VEVPPVEYVTVDGCQVAYQVIGDGPALLGLKQVFASLDESWRRRSVQRMWHSLSQVSRHVWLDLPGLGASDPVPAEMRGDLDLFVAAALAVMDAAGMDRASVWSEHEQAAIAVRLAVEHPERVDRVMLSQPRVRWTSPYTPSQAAATLRRDWGRGRVVTQLDADPGEYERSSCSPTVAADVMLGLGAWDVWHLLPMLTQEVVVQHLDAEGLLETPYEETRAVADAIPNARFVSAKPTANYWGDGTWEAIVGFVAGDTPHDSGTRELLTVVFTDIVDSTRLLSERGDRAWREVLDFFDAAVADAATADGGRVANHTGDGQLVEAPSPGAALRIARAARDAMRAMQVEVRAGVHAGEVERRESGDIGGMAVHVGARIMGLAGPGEILVSRTVADLLTGSGTDLEDRGEHELKGVPGRWQVLAAL
jgi:class 3 adenylate cyclase